MQKREIIIKTTRFFIYASAVLLFGSPSFAAVVVDSRENWIMAQVDWGTSIHSPWTEPPHINLVQSTSLTDPFDEWIDASDSNNDHYLNMTPYVQFFISQTATVSNSGFMFSGISIGQVTSHPWTPPFTLLYLSNYTNVTFHVTEPSIATIDIGDVDLNDLAYVYFDGIGEVYDGEALALEPDVSYQFTYGLNYYGPIPNGLNVLFSSDFSMNIAAIPEPSTTALFVGGATAAFTLIRRRIR